MLKISAWVGVAVVVLASPVLAKDVKSNPDLFRQCADYDNERASLRETMDNESSRANYMNDEKGRLEDEIDVHEREVKRLDEILKIMRNNDGVWDKRDRAYNRYSRAFDEYDDFMIDYRRSFSTFQSYIDRSDRLRDRLNAECFGTWSNETLDRFCDTNEKRFQMFCSRFDT